MRTLTGTLPSHDTGLRVVSGIAKEYVQGTVRYPGVRGETISPALPIAFVDVLRDG